MITYLLLLISLVVGNVSSPGLFSLTAVSQNGDSGFVSQNWGEVTVFQDAAWHGTIGLLAHDYLSGQYFYQLEPGDAVFVDDRTFIVTRTEVYFGDKYEGFRQFYEAGYPLVLQTCYGNGWFFAIAEPGYWRPDDIISVSRGRDVWE